MLLAERQIRALISALLLEGVKDDLIAANPGINANEVESLAKSYPKGIAWLNARFGPNRREEETHPIDDAMITIMRFAEKDKAIGDKYAAGKQFTKDVDEAFLTRPRRWSRPNEITTMSIDDMELILGLAERKKQSVDVSQEEDIEGDRVGRVGPWNMWVPTTMEKSCKIAGYDPVTRNPKTTWCTARTVGSNLFYHYVGRQNEDIVLFYIIKDSPSEDNDWLSVGFLNGKPVLDGRRGGLTVNRANDGLTPDTLRGILGDAFDPIMSGLEAKAVEMKGIHPAKEKVRAAGQDLELLKQMLKGHSEEENKAFLSMIIELREVSPDVMMFLANSDDERQLRKLTHKNYLTPEALDVIISRAFKIKSPDLIRVATKNDNVSPEAIERLASSSDNSLKLFAAESPKASPETLRRLVQELPPNYLSGIARNPSTPVDVLMDFAKSSTGYALAGLSDNKNLPSEVIDAILDNPLLAGPRAESMGYVGNSLAVKKNLTPAQLAKIYKLFKNSRGTALLHPALPLDILNADLDSPYKATRAQAHRNPQTPPERLASFLADHSYTAYQHVCVLNNPNVPADALRAAYADENLGKERFEQLALNPNAPPDLLMQLIKKSTPYTRELVTHNPNVTDEMLKILSKDRQQHVAWNAKERIKQRAAAGVNEALARVIRRLLR